MGIEHKAIVGVGLPATKLAKDEEDFYEKYGEDKELRLIPYHFDAGFSECHIGVVLYEAESEAIELQLLPQVQMKVYHAMDTFRKVTGVSGKLFVCSMGY